MCTKSEWVLEMMVSSWGPPGISVRVMSQKAGRGRQPRQGLGRQAHKLDCS